jgi:hypothetical protein
MPTLTGELAALMDWLSDPSRTIVAHLSKAPISFTTGQISLTDLVEADFPGYAPVTIDSWDPIDFEDDLYGEAVSGELQWQAGPIVTPQSIYVAYLTIVEGSNPVKLLWPVVLPLPYVIGAQDETFAFMFRIGSANLDTLSADSGGD